MTTTLSPWDVYEDLGYDPHPCQEMVLESAVRNRVVAAGRRFGKSDLGGHELVPEALVTKGLASALIMEGRRREFWIVGPEYSDAEKEFRVVWNALKRLDVPFDKPGSYNNAESGMLDISLWEGAFQIHGKSAKHPDTLVGEGLSGVILSEAAKLKERVWTKFLRPTLGDYNGWALMTSTPEGKNWFYERWAVGQDPKRPDWASWRFPAWRNSYVYRTPTNDADVRYLQEVLKDNRRQYSIYEIRDRFKLTIDDEILAAIGDLTPETFNQEYGADFSEFAGRVFKEFDEEVHVFDLEWEPTWDVVAAVDYGFTNPNVWLLIQIGPWGQIHVYDELYESGLTALQFGRAIRDRGLAPSKLRTFYPDPAGPSDTRQLEQILKVRHSGGTGGELKDRIDSIRHALRRVPELAADSNPDKRPQLKINRRCVNTIREFLDYRYPETRGESDKNTAENPMKKDDHTPEALGRFFAGYFGTLAQNASPLRKRRATIRR